MRRLVFGAALVFVVATAIAMALYPGGTFLDPHTVGHRFFANFFCDLFHAHGLDGRPNPGAPLAQVGMLAMLVALWAHFMVTARTLGSGVLRFLVRVLGTMSALAAIAVPLTPSDRFPRLHGVCVLLAAGPGVLAVTCAVVGLFRDRALFSAWLGVALAVTAAIDAGLYAWQMRTQAPTPLALPALQKVAAGVLVLWMVVVSAHDRRRARAPA